MDPKKLIISVVLIAIILVGAYFGYTYYTTAVSSSQKQKVLIVGATEGDPVTLDPAVAYETNDMRIIRGVYEKLLDYKPGSVSDFVPGLAERWEVSSDGKIYTFHLRQGVRFHDGTPFNASAVEYSWNRTVTLGKGPSWFIVAPVSDFKVVDTYTVSFTLSDTYTDFLHRIASSYGFYVISPSLFMGHATADDPWAETWAYDHMSGTGPYMLEEWMHHDHVSLVKNNDYWKGWAGNHLERIIVREVTETTTQKLLLEKGDIDVAYPMSISDLLELKGNPDVQSLIEPSFNTLYFFMHNQRAPLNDVRVRQAISYAYDYGAATLTVWNGTAKQMRGPLPSTLWGWDPNTPTYTTNLEKAKQLMAEAGYANGVDRTLTFVYVAGNDQERMAGEILKISLSKIGINVEPKAVVDSEVSGLAKDPNTCPDLLAVYWYPDYADPIDFLYVMFHSTMQGEAGWNWMYYSNPRVDQLLDEATLTMDVTQRTAMYSELQKILVEDAPSLYIFEYPATMGMRTWVKGYVYSPIFVGSLNFYDMYKQF